MQHIYSWVAAAVVVATGIACQTDQSSRSGEVVASASEPVEGDQRDRTREGGSPEQAPSQNDTNKSDERTDADDTESDACLSEAEQERFEADVERFVETVDRAKPDGDLTEKEWEAMLDSYTDPDTPFVDVTVPAGLGEPAKLELVRDPDDIQDRAIQSALVDYSNCANMMCTQLMAHGWIHTTMFGRNDDGELHFIGAITLWPRGAAMGDDPDEHKSLEVYRREDAIMEATLQAAVAETFDEETFDPACLR